MVKQKRDNILFQILIIITIFCVVIVIIVYGLANVTLSVYEQCCNANNATYILYECQCNAALSLGCGNLTCGSYCRFNDGSLIKAKEVKCNNINTTI